MTKMSEIIKHLCGLQTVYGVKQKLARPWASFPCLGLPKWPHARLLLRRVAPTCTHCLYRLDNSLTTRSWIVCIAYRIHPGSFMHGYPPRHASERRTASSRLLETLYTSHETDMEFYRSSGGGRYVASLDWPEIHLALFVHSCAQVWSTYCYRHNK